MEELFLFICDLILIFLTPIILLIISIATYKHPAKYGDGNGYNTPYAKQSKEIWNFAQILASKIMFYCALISFLIILLIQILVHTTNIINIYNIEIINNICMNNWIIILPIYFGITEFKLRKKFKSAKS